MLSQWCLGTVSKKSIDILSDGPLSKKYISTKQYTELKHLCLKKRLWMSVICKRVDILSDLRAVSNKQQKKKNSRKKASSRCLQSKLHNNISLPHFTVVHDRLCDNFCVLNGRENYDILIFISIWDKRIVLILYTYTYINEYTVFVTLRL